MGAGSPSDIDGQAVHLEVVSILSVHVFELRDEIDPFWQLIGEVPRFNEDDERRVPSKRRVIVGDPKSPFR